MQDHNGGMLLDELCILEAESSATESPAAMASEPDEFHVTDTVVKAVLEATPDHGYAMMVEAVKRMADQGAIRHGSLFAGTGFGQRVFRRLCVHLGVDVHHVNVLVVEKAKFKQKWILAHDKPAILCSDGAELEHTCIKNIITGEMVPLPQLDVADIGFSCKCFSLLNYLFHSNTFEDAIQLAKGSPGQTAKFGMSLIKRKPPRL